MDPRLERIKRLASFQTSITKENVRIMISDLTNFTRDHLLDARFPKRKITALLTKFRDAGRRSPPWRPTSKRVPGRPQDGADGNRRVRWLFEKNHKFYADEVTATLSEIRYYLQLLSMDNAPPLPANSLQDEFLWLAGHRIIPGAYKDPIQIVGIDIREVMQNPRLIQSGHLVPLDRGGRHEPANAFLVLASSNQLQGNLTLHELLDLMERILKRHKKGG